MQIKIGYSPCPNDCYIFDALIHHKIETEGLDFIPVIEDVEKLNLLATRSELDFTKLSYHAFGHVADKYILLTSGSALGNGCGPLVISKADPSKINLNDLNLGIVLPGKLTTANLLLSMALPQLKKKSFLVFSEIENAVLNEKYDLGVIIHENRFTYSTKGLKRVLDLGAYWETFTGMPIPLGGIAGKRELDPELLIKVNRLIRKSIEYANQNPESSMGYIQSFAQEMNLNVIKNHIDLYVNDYSLDLGEKGKNAVKMLMEKGMMEELFKIKIEEIFLEG